MSLRYKGLRLSCIVFAMLYGVRLTIAVTSDYGPRTGTRAPAFQATDQFGHVQTAATLSGPKGLVLLFFRSADW
jgi:hypothetical protein